MMDKRISYFLVLTVAAAMLASGCATAVVTPTTVSVQSPAPEAPDGTQYSAYVIGKYQELAPGKWMTAGYIVDMPGFPLPLFSDPDNKDVTTAHLTFCTYGTSEDGMEQYVATQYYDETPDGDFANVESLCGGEEGVHEFGGDRAEPYDAAQGFARTVVDRTIVIEASDGTSIVHPAPQGTEWHVPWKEDLRTGLLEVWLFTIPSAESGTEPGTG